MFYCVVVYCCDRGSLRYCSACCMACCSVSFVLNVKVSVYCPYLLMSKETLRYLVVVLSYGLPKELMYLKLWILGDL